MPKHHHHHHHDSPQWHHNTTIIITTITTTTITSDTNFEETLSTLKYAHTTKSVNNRPVMNIDQDPKDKMIRWSYILLIFWDLGFIALLFPHIERLKALFDQGTAKRDQDLTSQTGQPENRHRALLKTSTTTQEYAHWALLKVLDIVKSIICVNMQKSKRNKKLPNLFQQKLLLEFNFSQNVVSVPPTLPPFESCETTPDLCPDTRPRILVKW